MSSYRPRIVCLFCAFGWGYQADRRETPSAPWVPVVCTGRIDAEQLLELYRDGADGVLILGCPDGECHFQEGNHQCRKRLALLRPLLAAEGVDPARLAAFFGRDPAGERIPVLMAELAAEIATLGPLQVQGDG